MALGGYQFEGKSRGILEFVKQVGSHQFDPVNVCGRSPGWCCCRVKGFTKQMLHELLYQDRQLIDYFDKNLSILPRKAGLILNAIGNSTGSGSGAMPISRR